MMLGWDLAKDRRDREAFPKLRGLRPHHQIDLALQELKQRHELIE
jgi:hypothetical protein